MAATSGGRVEWNPPPGSQDLGRAVVERQAIMNRVRGLCEAAAGDPAASAAGLARDVIAALDDADPLGALTGHGAVQSVKSRPLNRDELFPRSPLIRDRYVRVWLVTSGPRPCRPARSTERGAHLTSSARLKARGFLRDGDVPQHSAGGRLCCLALAAAAPAGVASPARSVTVSQRFADHSRGHVPKKAHARCHRMPCGGSLTRRTYSTAPASLAEATARKEKST